MSNSEFGETCSQITLKLLEQLTASDGKENVLISPFLIQNCMAMVFNGAQGVTADEIATALGYNSKCPSEVAETFHEVLNNYEASDLLKIANKVYIQEGATLKSDYIGVIKEKYHGDAEVINFKEKASAAGAMNAWVEKKTNGKISNLISPKSLGADTRIVLLNALHFKGQWCHIFDPANTKPYHFYITKDKSVTMDFMYQKQYYKYYYFEDLNSTAVEMAYENSDLSLFLLLPDEREGLQELTKKLQNVNIADLSKKMLMKRVELIIPKFKVDYAVEMSDVLQKMGISEAFSNRADFSNILEPAENICISKFFHKVTIDVTEKGTEAAAASVIMPFCSRPPIIVANHPFLYWIWNEKNVVLFAGALVNPPEKV